MKKIIVCLILLLLSGCATLEEPQKSFTEQYQKNNWPLVQSGTMKYSDYYKGVYQAITKESFATRGQYLTVFNGLIDAALKHEDGKMSKNEFDSFRRESVAKFDIIDNDYNIKMQEIEASRPAPVNQKPTLELAPMEPWPMMKSPKRTTCTTNGNVTECQTN